MGLAVPRSGGRRARRLLVLGVFLTLAVLGLGAIQARAAPSSLMNETFNGTSGSISGTCMTGANGSFTFSARGTADGPYPGSFTESGSFTMTDGNLTAFSASFTISSSFGSATGSKSLFVAPSGAECNPTGSDGLVVIDSEGGAYTYTATINGSYHDTGTALVADPGLTWSHGTLENFDEDFVTSNLVTPIPLPTSKGRCKHGGWKKLRRRVQEAGDCVSFVATSSNNPPAGRSSGRIALLPRRPAAAGLWPFSHASNVLH